MDNILHPTYGLMDIITLQCSCCFTSSEWKFLTDWPFGRLYRARVGIKSIEEKNTNAEGGKHFIHGFHEVLQIICNVPRLIVEETNCPSISRAGKLHAVVCNRSGEPAVTKLLAYLML